MPSFPRSLRVSSLAFAFLCLPLGSASAADPFEDQVLPFLKTYCVQCHNPKKASAELDLSRYATAAKAVEDFRQWEHVLSFVKKEEMPPAKAKQPTPELRAQILKAVEEMLTKEARKIAGDPGVVPPRRLTNAEFDYSIHDLTGVDIRPTASFPVDPASGEGFTNTGEALTMSPALFKKVYAAAQHVAEHALLTTEGLRFAPYPVVAFADRQKYYEQAILRFYDDHKVDYEACLTALWTYRHRPETQKRIQVEAWAKERNLSPKYLRALHDALQGDVDDYYLGWLRRRWDSVPGPKAGVDANVPGETASALRSLAADIRSLSLRLCPAETPAIIANAGNSPVDHLERRRRMAASRDAFDVKSFGRQRYRCEIADVGKLATVKLVVTVAPVGGAEADGIVVIQGAFGTGNPDAANTFAEAKKKNWTLRGLLADHAPDRLKTLPFGPQPGAKSVAADALAVKAPGTVEIEIPAAAFKTKGNVHFFADCQLVGSTRGVVDLRIAGGTAATAAPRPEPPLIDAAHAIAKEAQASGEAFCRLFPNRFYFVDDPRGVSAGFHLIEGYFRDDQPLCKWVLSEADNKELDRLWKELRFVTDIWHKMLRGFVFFERSERNILQHPDFDSVREEDPELTKDEPLSKFKAIYLRRTGVKAVGEELAKHPTSIFFEDIRAGLKDRADTLAKTEPQFLKDIEDFARRAYRRPLTESELAKLRTFFREVREHKEHGLEQAVQASIVRILVSPHFCYRAEVAPEGKTVAPLPDLALASRLSYFVWGSVPDEELLAVAAAGKLRDDAVLRAQTRRMLKDPKASRFALEFFGQWLGYRDFLKQEAVNRQAFPTFDDGLRLAMFEEPTRLATYVLRENLPLTELLESDTTFVNKKLAQHYGLPFAGKPDAWEKVDGLRKQGRGGILGMAVFLTKNSQPQRTSPVKRGFWVVHKVLGEHIPAPPADVAALPAKETDTQGKTIRQLLVLHTEDVRCARCHVRFDFVGLTMEGFDPIGRSRTKDLAGRPIDNAVVLPSGKEVRGVPEFSRYLASDRKQEFAKTLSQKLLGYALGRSVQLSDHALLERMQSELDAHDFRPQTFIETVVLSPQFRNQRCRDFATASFMTKGNGP